jgi:hypothetical protein
MLAQGVLGFQYEGALHPMLDEYTPVDHNAKFSKSRSKNIMLCGRAFAASVEPMPSGGKREHYG